MREAVAYIRVSTFAQATEGVSLEAQKRRIEQWCLANDYKLADVKIDAGISGGRADNRPALNEALKKVISGPRALVVYSLSRLARSTRDTLSIGEKLEKAGADLVSLCEKIDTSSASGKMIFRLMAVLAEFERDLLAERTRAAMAHLKSQGRLIGGVPLGYQLAKDGRTLVADPKEQRIVSLILTLRSQGKSYRQIKEHLEGRGILAKGGGHIWHPSALRYIILKNGKRDFSQEPPNAHSPNKRGRKGRASEVREKADRQEEAV